MVNSERCGYGFGYRMAYKEGYYYSAENGFHIRPRGESWQRMRSDVDISWMSAVKQVGFVRRDF